MNILAERQEEQTILNFIVRRHGSATLEEIKQAKLVSSVNVTSVMRRLIAVKVVQLQGDASYKLVAKETQPELAPPSQLGGCRPETEPGSTGIQSPVNPVSQPPEPTAQRQCGRCKDWKPVSQFPQRPGLIRPARLCETCLNTPVAVKWPKGDRSVHRVSSNDAAIAIRELNSDKHTGQLVDIPNPFVSDANGKHVFDIEAAATPLLAIKITQPVRDYLIQLRKTGLWGATIEEVAERLICRGLIVQLGSGGMLAASGEISR